MVYAPWVSAFQDLRCLGARDSSHDPLANRIASESNRAIWKNLSLARDHPNSWKNLRECRGKWKSFMWVPMNSGNRSGSCSENYGLCIAQVVNCHSENGKSLSEFRELLWEYPGTLRLFTLRASFSKIGVVPRLLTKNVKNSQDITAIRTDFGVSIRIVWF